MREVRMTFGEHLEELRNRILVALLYLAVGVTISMIYGSDLMEWTLKPHYHALSVAQRGRVIAHMQKTVSRLDELTSVAPPAPTEGQKPLVKGEVRWEVLFARDVALPQLYGRLEGPFQKYEAWLRDWLAKNAPTVPAEERNRLVAGVRDLGSEFSRALVAEFASEFDTEEYPRIPQRFRELQRRLEEGGSTLGPSKIQSVIGWGKSISDVLRPLGQFIDFLDRQEKQAAKSQASLDILRKWTSESDLPRALNEILASLEKDAEQVVEGTSPRIWVISYIESFSTYFKVALIIGAFIAMPGILYELWKFVGAGLYAQEQKYVVTILPFSLALFLIGCAFGYFIMIPVGLEFLAGWGVENVELSFTLGSYVNLFFTLTLILGLVFQTPLIMIFLAKIGLVSTDLYIRGRRVAILSGVIIAVLLTPPDPFSWSLMAVPMLILYEVGILACRLLVKKRPAEVAET